MPGPLMTATDLQVGLQDITVIDCRWYLGEPGAGLRAYEAGHLPTASYCSLDNDLSGPIGPGRHPLPAPEAFAESMERFGVTAERPVVAYDDRGGAVASRLWWMLTDQGHSAAHVLDGGIQAWVDAGYALTTADPTPHLGSFSARPWAGTIDRNGVAARGRATAVIDARSQERYVGAEEPVDAKAGHIPRALSLPLTGNLDEHLRFLDGTMLRERFTDAGIESGTDVISQCGSGVTACHNILAMEVAGLGRPLLYVGSWSDWSSSEMPVATGSEP
jgi:thiosulfate/3-mercaptopyruvate sulfurtransferase